MFNDCHRTRGGGEGSQIPGTGILAEVAKTLGSIFSVELVMPDFSKFTTPEKKVKEFCVGLLENPVNHAWWPAIRSLGVEERTAISASLFLTRKALPSPPDPHQAEKHAKLMSAPAPNPPNGFLDFIDNEIDKIFEVGWDRGYASHVFSHSPTSSACLQYSRKKGGAARWLSEQGSSWFEDFCLGGAPVPWHHKVKYAVVETGGKQRGVTISDGMHHVLGPLHRTLYDKLDQQPWLLRGEARGKKFKSFKRVKGEIFVSGDYESATDNLSLEVTEHIVDRILRNTRFVPSGVKLFAKGSLRSEIHYPGGRVVQQRRGQLMGNYLSFPLLCLQNYLAFRFSISRDVPLAINGDDIVFRCLPHEYRQWKERVGAAGLTLSAGKTLVDSSIFSLNSAFFRGGRGRTPREIAVIRPKSCVALAENPLSGGAFTRFIRGHKGLARRLLGGMWLRHRRVQIQSSGRSVEALGIPADNSQLHTANLAVREAFFRGTKNGLRILECPVPPVPLRGQPLKDWVCVPRNSAVKLSQEIAWRKDARGSFHLSLWQRKGEAAEPLWEEWWDGLKRTGREAQWLAWKRTTRHVHRMGFKLNLGLRPPAVRNVVKTMWVPSEVLPYLTSRFRGIGVH